MDTELLLLIVICVLGVVNIVNAILSYWNGKQYIEHNNRLIKAIIAKNIQEYATVESSPEDHLKQIREENKLAEHAAKIADRERMIPITY